MTFKKHLTTVNLILVIVLLAALALAAVGVVSSQAIASHEDFDSGSAENVQLHTSPASEIACACGDPGGGNECC